MRSIKLFFILCLILVGFNTRAQRFAVASTAWNLTSTWSTSQGGSPGASVPTSSDDVYTEGFSVSIPTGVVAECNSLYVAYNVANGINFTLGSPVLNIYGELAAYDPSIVDYAIPTTSVIKNSTSNLEINFIGSTFSEVINQLGWGSSAPLRKIAFNAGNGNTIAIHDLFIASSGSATVKTGTIDILGNLQSVNSSATITVNSGATLLVSSGAIIGTSGNTTAFPTITNNGTITSSPNTTSYINASVVNLNAGSIFNVGYNGSNQTQGWWYQNTSPSSVVADVSSTVNYNASVAQNIYAQGYGNLTLGGSGSLDKTVAGSGSLNIQGNLTFANTGVSLTSSNAVIFDGTNGQTVSGGGTANFNGGVTVNKTSGTLTFSQDINWQGQLNLSQVGSGVIFTSASTATATSTASIVGSNEPSFYGLAIGASGNLTSSSGNINVAGNLTNNGTFNANNGTVILNGNTTQTISGSSTTPFANLTTTNSTNISVSSLITISDALTLSGGVFNTGGNVTLLSVSNRDARIAEITNGATFSGNVTVQRYLPNTNGSRAYRYLASQVTNATVSQWKASFPITGTFSDPTTTFTGITGINSTSPSMFIYNEAHTPTTTMNDRYESYPYDGTSSSSSPLVNGTGYAAFVRQTAPITLSLTGTPRIGPASVSVTAQSAGGNDGYNLIGNPFASPISWENVTIPSGVDAQIALQDNTNNAGGGAGNYVYYTQGGSGIPASYQGTIASGQAFFVRATSNATITFQEDDKVSTANPQFVREGNTLTNILRINVSGNGLMDELLIHFRDGAKDEADQSFDALKMQNPIINFSSLSADGRKMAINTMSTLSCDREVSLVVEGTTAGAYQFNFSEYENFDNGVVLHLVDYFTGKTSEISALHTTYNFDITNDANSYGAARFKVKFVYPDIITDLALESENVCEGADAQVVIANTQSGVSYYATINGNVIGSSVLSQGGELTLSLPGAQFVQGDNTIILNAVRGNCSAVALTQTALVKKDVLYSIQSLNVNNACQKGEVTITASGAPEGGSYRWYEQISGTELSGQTSSVFVTPSLNKSKTYYVSVVNSLGCEGDKKEVLAKVIAYDDAMITEADGTTLRSNYDTGNQWYLDGEMIIGATSKELQVSESGTYKVVVSLDGGCSTSSERSMIVTGLKDELEQIQIYPNPVITTLTVKLPADNGVAIGAVYNELGQSMGQLQFINLDNFLSSEFNFSEKVPGLYIVRINQGDRVINHKIIKK